jgi:hypothetical protein
MPSDSSLYRTEVSTQALEETDREKLHRLVGEAEVAIFLRREELKNSPDSHEELSTMAVVTEALRSITAHQLDDRGAARGQPVNERG